MIFKIIITQYMASTFDPRKSRDDLDRKLTILKGKMKLPSLKLSPKKVYKRRTLQHTEEQIFSENNKELSKKIDKSGLVNHFANIKSLSYVKLFICQLKKNTANMRSQRVVESNKVTREIDRLYNISYNDGNRGTRGIQSRDHVELIISVLTVIAIILLHFLSTFQVLFEDFRSQYSGLPEIKTIKYACLLFTVIKIISSFILVTMVLGKKVQYIEQIALNYITNMDFYLDLFAFVSTILLLTFPYSQYAGVFGFIVTIMNVVYIQRMESAIDVYFITNSVKKQIFALFKLLLANIFVVHFMASLLVWLILFEDTQNWMDKYGISEESWWVRYIYSLYWSASIIATVGFGDITINNYAQALVLTIIILFGCLILSYNIAQVSNIINNLKATPNEVKHQLSVLRRLANINKINQNLHHSIGEYIIHSAQIKKTFQIKERLELIETLPSQMREEFIQQSSKNFFASIPFFFMLQCETKKSAVQKMQIEVLSPNEYITHKRLGLTKIYFLRKGVIGLAYKKKGSRLNGTILDKISIKQQQNDPQLLNTYLLIRGKKLVYDIICQEYCVISYLQFSDFIQALKQSQRDFEIYHQSRDEAQFRINQWDKKQCKYCSVKHSLFVCPKMHYIPLRSQTFLKSQRSDDHNQKRPLFNYYRKKPLLAKYSPIKLWAKLFIHVENIFETNVQKDQLLRMKKTLSNTDQQNSIQKWQNSLAKDLIQQYFLRYNQKISEFYLDVVKDYKYYFNKHNPCKLAQTILKKDFLPITIERLRSV